MPKKIPTEAINPTYSQTVLALLALSDGDTHAAQRILAAAANLAADATPDARRRKSDYVLAYMDRATNVTTGITVKAYSPYLAVHEWLGSDVAALLPHHSIVCCGTPANMKPDPTGDRRPTIALTKHEGRWLESDY
jgi:hypothetical protein